MRTLRHSLRTKSAKSGARRIVRALTLAPLLCLLMSALVLSSCHVSVGLKQPTPTVNVTGKGGISVPVKVTRDAGGSTLVLISLTINGQGPFPFALDTGASVSLIDRGLAQQLGLPKDGRASQVSGVGGTEQVIPVDVETWNAGKIRLPPATLAAAQVPAAQRASGMVGLLGSDVLSQFGAFLLDYSNGTFTVYSQVASTAPRDVRHVAVA